VAFSAEFVEMLEKRLQNEIFQRDGGTAKMRQVAMFVIFMNMLLFIF